MLNIVNERNYVKTNMLDVIFLWRQGVVGGNTVKFSVVTSLLPGPLHQLCVIVTTRAAYGSRSANWRPGWPIRRKAKEEQSRDRGNQYLHWNPWKLLVIIYVGSVDRNFVQLAN